MLDSGQHQPDFSSTPGMDLPFHVSVNVIFTQLKHLRYLLASDPGLRREIESQRETQEWREKLNQFETICGFAYMHICRHLCMLLRCCITCLSICSIWPQCTFTIVLHPRNTYTEGSNVISHSQYFDLETCSGITPMWRKPKYIPDVQNYFHSGFDIQYI